MSKLQVDAVDLAMRYVGVGEVAGQLDNPVILAMLRLDAEWPEHDEVPWCSAFLNWICWHLRLPRSRSLMARSWLEVGRTIQLPEAEIGFDVVVLWRGPKNDGRTGHVGLYDGQTPGKVFLLGGNQSDGVSVAPYPVSRVLGVRRLV